MNNKIKFLGIPIGKEYIINDVYRKRILFHETKFNLNETHIIYRIFGIKYLTVTFEYGETKFNYFNIIKFNKEDKNKVDLLLPVLNEYLREKIGKDKFDVICILCHSGETFLSMYHMKEYIEKNKINNPIFITTRVSNTNITKMYFPEIPSIRVPNIFNAFYSPQNYSKELNGCTYRIILSSGHFNTLHNNVILGDKLYFYEELKKTMNVSSDITAIPEISEKDKETAKIKMKLIGLKKPFIYITTESVCSGTCTGQFWENLHVEIFKLNQKLNGGGYDMFYNKLPLKSQNTYYKYCYLSLPQARYVASQAEIIIGVRSGLMDNIANPESKIFCIYFPFNKPKIETDKFQSCYSLKQLPFVNPDNIYEYNTEQMSEDEIMENIINKIYALRKENETV